MIFHSTLQKARMRRKWNREGKETMCTSCLHGKHDCTSTECCCVCNETPSIVNDYRPELMALDEIPEEMGPTVSM
jgi:hypothetical protein